MPGLPKSLLALALGAVLTILAPATRAQQPWPKPPPPDRDEFSVMEYNLWRFSYEDRDKDGQKDNFKPEDQIAALVAIVSNARPDILAFEEIGDADSFDILLRRLHEAGLTYLTNSEHFVLSHATVGLGVLSRFPIAGNYSITNESFSIGETTVPVSRGFLCVDIQVNENYRFRLFVAHLKSKLYNPLGQTEMRRNEARLLNKHVRRMIAEDKNLNILVVGDMNDTITSAPLRTLTGWPAILHDLRPKDFVGDIWTHYWGYQEEYARINYAFVNDAMKPEVVPEKSYLPRDDNMTLASDHRPVIAVYKAYDQTPE